MSEQSAMHQSEACLGDPEVSLRIEEVCLGEIELEQHVFSYFKLRGASRAQPAGGCADPEMCDCFGSQKFQKFNACGYAVRSVVCNAQMFRPNTENHGTIR